MPDTLRVLYVDDDPGLLEIGKLFLEVSGRFSVDIITSASAALTLLNATKFDAIISDYQMPGMDGIQFLKSVRASANAIPFILFTGRGREEIVIQALNEGANFYLQKGGEPEAQFAELVHKIQIAVEHHRAAEKIQALNRLYSVLSATNKAIFRIQTKKEFFSEICRILVETGGFRMAWIGLADLEQKLIRPVASAGYVDGYLDSINISTEDIPQGRGPTGTAFREGKYFWSNDITQDPRMEPWRDNALKRGYLANAAFAFALGTKNAGVLSLYAPVTGFFDGPIIDLLEELAVDISFYLRTIDDQNERILAINARRVSEERFHGLFDTINSGVAIYEVRNEGKSGKDYIIKDFNKIALEIEGKKKDEVIGKSLFDLRPTIDEYGLIPVFQQVWKTGVPAYFPQKIYIDEKYSSWYENRVFRLHNGEIVAVYDDVTERKRADTDLRESEEALSAMLNGITESAFLMTPEGNVIAANETVARRLGMKQADDLVGQNALKLLPKDVQMSREIKIREVIQSGLPAHFEDVREGRVISQTIYPVKDPDGSVRRLSIFGVDVTDRKRAEEERKEREEVHHSILETAMDGFVMLDVRGHLIEANDTYCRMSGYSVQELLTMNINDLEAAESAADTASHIRCIIQKGEDRFQSKHRRKDGSSYDIESSIQFKPDYGGRFIVFIRDITERKQAEKALMENEETFKALAENANVGILVAVSDENHTYANRRAGEILGYGIDELLKRSIQDLAVPGEAQKLTERFRKRLLGEKIPHQYETVLLHKSGNSIPVEISAARTFWHGQPADMVLIHDITKRKQAEETIRQALDEKEALLKEVHHRVKNNLAAIISLIGLQTTTLTDPVAISRFKDLETRIRSMALVHESLYLQKDLSKINIAAYTENLTLELFQVYGTGRIINRRIEMADVKMPIETAIPCGLVITEIVTNSLKYAFPTTFSCETTRREPCAITITLRRDGNDYVLGVSDNGIGMPKETGATDPPRLGLYLVRLIVKHQLWGSYEIDTDRGTAYTIRFPETKN